MKPLYKITKDVNPGIYNGTFIANLYADKIIITNPTVKWHGNTGGYHEEKLSIRDQETVDKVIAEMKDGCEDQALLHINYALFGEWMT